MNSNSYINDTMSNKVKAPPKKKQGLIVVRTLYGLKPIRGVRKLIKVKVLRRLKPNMCMSLCF